MDKPKKELDAQEQEIQNLANNINPSQDVFPDSLAEATTVPLDDDALGGNATEDVFNKNKEK